MKALKNKTVFRIMLFFFSFLLCFYSTGSSFNDAYSSDTRHSQNIIISPVHNEPDAYLSETGFDSEEDLLLFEDFFFVIALPVFFGACSFPDQLTVIKIKIPFKLRSIPPPLSA